MATPFDGEVFTFTQPDGTTLQVRGWGNQHSAVFETLDGYTIVRDPDTGYFRYAGLSPDAESLVERSSIAGAPPPADLSRGVRTRRPSASRARSDLGDVESRWQERRRERLERLEAARSGAFSFAPPSEETEGTFVGLCMLVEFPDVPGTIARDEVEHFCNEVGYTGFGNNGSVHDYFLDTSNGKVRYTNVVTDWYTAQHNRDYYTDPTISYGVRARELIREALDDLRAKGFDFSQLSADGSGYVYATNVYYAGTRINNWSEGLWPHQSSLSPAYQAAPGRRMRDYQVTDMTPELTLGTFCHENGHMLCDFPDLYDYDGDSNGIGRYCLMCAGGRDKRNPAHVGAYLKYNAGWLDNVSPVVSGQSVTLSASNDEVLLHSKNQDEYYVIENRVATGRDRSLPSEGLAIWHCDEHGNNRFQQGTPGQHFECALEQADGSFHLESDINNGDSGDLFSFQTATTFGNATVPDSRWWDGSGSGLEISGIGAPGESISFVAGLAGGGVVVGAITQEATVNAEIPDASLVGASSSIDIKDAAQVASLAVSVDIDHSYRGDLRVTLMNPTGKAVVLHDRRGGNSDDLKASFDLSNTPGLALFTGDPTNGIWTLTVHDLARFDVGTLRSWSLRIQPSEAPSTVRLDESPGVTIPDDTPAGISRALSTSATGVVAAVTVEIDLSHTYVSDLVLTLVSPNGTEVVIHNRQGGSSDDIRREFDSASVPELADLVGESVAGDWRLKLSDRAFRDIGKLNSWGLTIDLD
jgi:M6 family metalloprotease-like protein